MNNNCKTITNVESYVSQICDLRKHVINEDNAYLKYELLFRGQADSDYSLMPSIGRDFVKGHTLCTPLLFEERNLIEMAKYKRPETFAQNMLPINLLALLQHYGIPTRLLDVTENALVALYFACKATGNQNTNGEVVVFINSAIDITNYPIINGIADSFRFATSSEGSLEHFFSRIKEQPYFLEQKWEHGQVNKTPKDGADWVENVCKDIIFVHATEFSERQRLQQGRYILFPNSIEEICGRKKFILKIEQIPKTHKSIVARFIIPSQEKKNILKTLSWLGIKEEILFGDNLEAVCNGIINTII